VPRRGPFHGPMVGAAYRLEGRLDPLSWCSSAATLARPGVTVGRSTSLSYRARSGHAERGIYERASECTQGTMPGITLGSRDGGGGGCPGASRGHDRISQLVNAPGSMLPGLPGCPASVSEPCRRWPAGFCGAGTRHVRPRSWLATIMPCGVVTPANGLASSAATRTSARARAQPATQGRLSLCAAALHAVSIRAATRGPRCHVEGLEHGADVRPPAARI
jgi:hypothetical protein